MKTRNKNTYTQNTYTGRHPLNDMAEASACDTGIPNLETMKAFQKKLNTIVSRLEAYPEAVAENAVLTGFIKDHLAEEAEIVERVKIWRSKIETALMGMVMTISTVDTSAGAGEAVMQMAAVSSMLTNRVAELVTCAPDDDSPDNDFSAKKIAGDYFELLKSKIS